MALEPSTPQMASDPVVAVWTWADVYARIAAAPPGRLWGIPRGGQIVAGLTGRAVDCPEDADVFVDDILDTGATAMRYTAQYHRPVWALTTKASGGAWVRFPWEETDPLSDLADTVRRQLVWIGENPLREGLQETPRRALRALADLTEGYRQDPDALLRVTFRAQTDQMIIVRDLPYFSLCEHHLLPFSGTVSLAYIPTNGRIVGLSKLARLVHCFSRRLQIQEQLTEQLADAIVTALTPQGVGVVVTGHHLCMAMRGIRSRGEMVTSALRGVLLTEPSARAEFLSLTPFHTR